MSTFYDVLIAMLQSMEEEGSPEIRESHKDRISRIQAEIESKRTTQYYKYTKKYNPGKVEREL